MREFMVMYFVEYTQRSPLGQRYIRVAAVSSAFSGQNVIGTKNLRTFTNRLGIDLRNMLSISIA